jgi:hypothetical protein
VKVRGDHSANHREFTLHRFLLSRSLDPSLFSATKRRRQSEQISKVFQLCDAGPNQRLRSSPQIVMHLLKRFGAIIGRGWRLFRCNAVNLALERVISTFAQMLDLAPYSAIPKLQAD